MNKDTALIFETYMQTQPNASKEVTGQLSPEGSATNQPVEENEESSQVEVTMATKTSLDSLRAQTGLDEKNFMTLIAALAQQEAGFLVDEGKLLYDHLNKSGG
jgi:hypothetical protein